MKRKGIALFMTALLMLSLCMPVSIAAASQPLRVAPVEKTLRLWYDEPAPDSDEGWETRSLPLGGGYFGANVFGGTETERIQITENSLWNTNNQDAGVNGLTNFAETYLDFGHEASGVSEYSRDLVLNDATAHVSYVYNGVTYTREYFTSYPDAVLAIKLTASEPGALSFTLRPQIPYLSDLRTGTVTASGDTIILAGHLSGYEIDYEGQYKLIPSGVQAEITQGDGTLTLQNADSAVILFTAGTNYELSPQVFSEYDNAKKLSGTTHPHEKLTQRIAAASQKSYEELLATHVEDYQYFFNRVSLNLGGQDSTKTTDQLLADYKIGIASPYLEELYFQYGRYLLISSSRKGTLPPNLQGLWNVHNSAPWSGGYWHNINIQMNYWPVFSTNLAELFESYIDYHNAYKPALSRMAANTILDQHPDNYDPSGDNGWSIGTGATPYSVYPAYGVGVDGNATGALMSEVFWDYYAFTQDKDLLENVVYPAVSGSANFMSKVMEPVDGLLLADPSASPEQLVTGTSESYVTVGTAWDQQLAYQGHTETIQAAEILGKQNDPLIDTLRSQLDYLDPVQIGYSGQIKEFREENYYGEIGEKNHRHVSQLVGLYPGTLINHNTPAWLDAAKTTLTLRGDQSTGWAMAHRLNLWARTGDAEHTYRIYQTLLRQGTLDNLWDTHPPFQIDGNFGGTAGVAEMLLQSHEGEIAPLAARPDAWASGSYTGLVARGNFEVSASWSGGHADTFEIVSNSGGTCRVRYPGITSALVQTASGTPVVYTPEGDDRISFPTTVGESYIITQIPEVAEVAAPSELTASVENYESAQLAWQGSSDAVSYSIYKAVESAPDYTLIASDITGLSFQYSIPEEEQGRQTTYRVTAVSADGRESDGATSLVLPVIVQTPDSATATFLPDGRLQIEIAPVEGADEYRIYQKMGDEYELVASSRYPYALIEGAAQDAVYGVSARTLRWESEIVDAVAGGEPVPSDNVLLHKPLTSDHTVNPKFPLEDAVDGNVDDTRWAFPDNIGGEYQVTVDLQGGYLLDTLRIYEYWNEGTRSQETTVETLYNGVWTKVIDKQPLLDPSSNPYTEFTLHQAKAEQLRLTFKNTAPENPASCSIEEITCSGIAFKGAEENNILRGIQSITASVTAASDRPLTSAFDGDLQTRWALSDGVTDPITVTLDLNNTYELDILKIYEFNAYDPDNAGTRSDKTTIEVYHDGSWKTIINEQPLADPVNPYTSFDMGFEPASKLRFTFVNEDNTNAISLYEITCSSVHQGVVDKSALYTQVLLAESVDPETISQAQQQELQAAVTEATGMLGSPTPQNTVDLMAQQLEELLAGMSTELPQAPFMKNVAISGNAIEGGTLTASWEYHDVNGDPEDPAGPKIRWQFSKNGVDGWTEIEGQTTPSLTLENSMVGGYVRAMVQALSTVDPKIGSYTTSPAAGPVAVDPDYENQNFHTILLEKTQSVYALADAGGKVKVTGISDRGTYDITDHPRLTYSSSDPYVMAVDSEGNLLSSHKAGYAFITATIHNEDGTTASARVIVHIYGGRGMVQGFESYTYDAEKNPHVQMSEDPRRTGTFSLGIANRPSDSEGTEGMWGGIDIYRDSPYSASMICEGWFYDNGTNQNANARLYFQSHDRDENDLSIPLTAQYYVGLDTSRSTTHYFVESRSAGRAECGTGYIGAGDVSTPLDGTNGSVSIPRVRGWHQVTLITTGDTADRYTDKGTVTIYIDGIEAFRENYVHPTMQVVRATSNGSMPYYSYYDDLAILENLQQERTVTVSVGEITQESSGAVLELTVKNQSSNIITADLIPLIIQENGNVLQGTLQKNISIDAYTSDTFRVTFKQAPSGPARVKVLLWESLSSMRPSLAGTDYYPSELSVVFP